jgi:hypothetical protein
MSGEYDKRKLDGSFRKGEGQVGARDGEADLEEGVLSSNEQ